MSATTPSHALGSIGGSAPAVSLQADDVDDRSIDGRSALLVSALAIEAQHGRFGCAVYIEEEQQLLLCEDLPCDFAFDEQERPPSNQAAGGQTEHHEEGHHFHGDPAAAGAGGADPTAAFGRTSHGVVESRRFFSLFVDGEILAQQRN